MPVQIRVECSVLHELPGNPLCPLQGVQVPVQVSLGGGGESRYPPTSLHFQIAWRACPGLLESKACGRMPFGLPYPDAASVKNAEGHLLRIKPEMEEGSLL